MPQNLEKTKSLAIDGKGIEALRTKIDQRLEEHFNAVGPDSRLGCAIRHGLLSPGKRIRPLMTLLACRQSGADEDCAIDAACAVEMVHAASLIMDDLPSMDDARLRRGALATHVVFGEGAAMLAAIALLNESFRLLTLGADISAEAKLRAVDHLSRSIGVEGLAGGQERDIACGKYAPGNVSLKEMEKRHLEKTGALFAAAAAIGGEIAGANPKTIEMLFEYGKNLGLAYQAFDDVIDVSCSEEQAGKDVDQDCEKSTVVSLLGADGAKVLGERRLARAIECARKASKTDASPLADLALLVGAKFGAMTTA